MPKGQVRKKGVKTVRGIIRITSKPTGFVEVENREKDIIVFEEDLNCALNKDEVEVEITGRSYDKEKGRVVRVIKRNKTQFVGALDKRSNGFSLVPDDFKFYRSIDLEPHSGAKSGLKALVEMDEWVNENVNPKGKIIEIIGEKGLHETEMRSILAGRGIIYDFPEEVDAEARQIFSAKNLGGQAQNRRDFRNITTFTIDPVDAKDFDDALSYEELDAKTLRIGVHIADVSHFVRPGTALDKEARKRSFSVYLVDRTIPMLPEVLSNNLCSLNPNVDRLAFSAVFDIYRESGAVKSRWFGKTIINSNKRFSYEEAQEVVDKARNSSVNEPELRDWREHEEIPSKELSVRENGSYFAPILLELDRLAKIYRQENKKNGAIEFETDEVRFELDAEGRPIKVFKKPRLDTMKMIEEWMLLANREVARFIAERLEKKGGVSIFRIHDLPNREKLEELSIFVRALGHDLPISNGSIEAKDINLMLSKLEGHASESLVRTAAVRAMAKAIYSTKNIGHFGLAFEYYTHFTSPIRRYPDLVTHRILEKHLRGENVKKEEYAEYQKICEEASEKEIVAAEAERESVRYKQVEFMQSKIGVEFEGVISGVTEWGIYIEEPQTKAEGMVRLKEMTSDSFALDEKNYAVVGLKTKKKYALGDKVKVKLVSADLDRKNLDFRLI